MCLLFVNHLVCSSQQQCPPFRQNWKGLILFSYLNPSTVMPSFIYSNLSCNTLSFLRLLELSTSVPISHHLCSCNSAIFFSQRQRSCFFFLFFFLVQKSLRQKSLVFLDKDLGSWGGRLGSVLKWRVEGSLEN